MTQNIPLIVLVDANGKVGSKADYHFGAVHANEENYGGELLHAFAAEFGLCAPQTFECADSGAPAGTWMDNWGQSTALTSCWCRCVGCSM